MTQLPYLLAAAGACPHLLVLVDDGVAAHSGTRCVCALIRLHQLWDARQQTRKIAAGRLSTH